jgi:phosphonate ABC transporter permease subunit PhnE
LTKDAVYLSTITTQLDAEPVAIDRPVTREDEGEGCAIVLTDVSVTYPPGVEALRRLSLRIERGRHVTILGSSGSGKTTLLGCLSGRVAVSDGSIRCDGRIATIHQDLRLVGERSALANVLHGCLGRHATLRTLLGFPRRERQRAIELLHRVGLGHRLHAPVRKLSGGEQQRVAIARALMQDPAILLADEPIASLDNANARDIMQLLSDIGRERQLTIVSVMHDCTLAEQHADRLLGLHQGQLVFDNKQDVNQTFQECRACRVLQHVDAHSPPPRVSELPRWARAGTWGVAIVLGLLAYGFSIHHLDIGPGQFEGVLFGLGRFLQDLIPTRWEQIAAIPWGPLTWSLVETLEMSLIGTTLGVLVSWPMAALAADNVGPRYIRQTMRFVLNTIRTIPSLIWALLFLAAVGFGNLAGVLALAAYSVGYLTKFFYEAFENVDPHTPDALREIGASGPQRFLHSVWPAARPAILASSLFMLEYNVRAASVLGIVGAGGIGFYFKQFYDFRDFPAMFACLVMLLIVVLILDAVSTRLRARLVHA